jgi:hypothetical protein
MPTTSRPDLNLRPILRLASLVLAAALPIPVALAQAPVAEPGAIDSAHTLIIHIPSAADSARAAARMRGAGSLQKLLEQADSTVKAHGGVHAENAQLFLAWNAPFGMKRSSPVCMPACGDSLRPDTLYLSFYPGRRAEYFTGFSGDLKFLATGQDTLGPWWHMESRGGENGGNVSVEWGPSGDMPGVQPWAVPGRGFALIDRTPTMMRLRLVFALAVNDAAPIDSAATYTLCRVIVKHRPSRHLAGCGQPVCVQWAKATFGFGLKDEPEVARGERFVSYGGPLSICDPFREPAVQAWRPKTPLTPPTAKKKATAPE